MTPVHKARPILNGRRRSEIKIPYICQLKFLRFNQRVDALANLAQYKVPGSIDFVQELPKDPVGKIQKRLLREKYAEQADA